MSWLVIVLVAAAAFGTGAFLLKIPRGSWAVLGTVLMLGLAGYAAQGQPAMPGAPKAEAAAALQSGEQMVEARRSLFDRTQPPPSYLTVSDGFARRGRFGQAAQLLKKGLADNPGHGEGWLALATALVEHAEGQVTPPALEAFARAKATLPGNPVPDYFLGAAWMRARNPFEARRVWGELLEATPQDAPWREDITQRVAALDEMIAQIEQLQAAERE